MWILCLAGLAPRSVWKKTPSLARPTSAPYWAERLGKQALTARQVGARQGALSCVVEGKRVKIKGCVAPYLTGQITLPDNFLKINLSLNKILHLMPLV